MKKTLLSTLLSLSALGISAQAVSVSGSFEEPFIAGTKAPAVAVFKPAQGHMDLVSETPVEKPDYTYSFDLSTDPTLKGKILYLGYNGEFFPFYYTSEEKITINAKDNVAEYSSPSGSENKVLARWNEIITPLHHLSHDKATSHAPADSVAAVMDKAWKESEAFVKTINTGNAQFDADARLLLPQHFMYEALQVFGMGWCAPTMDTMPKYIQHIFQADNFADIRLWTVPFTADNITWFAFVKDIVCMMGQGQTINFAVRHISDPRLREEYALYSLENGLVQGIKDFLDKNDSIFISDSARTRLAEVKRKHAVLQPGNEWVDMEYEDKDGNMHRLSEHLGKVVVIDVWATWCAPCRAELPHLLKLEKEMKGRNVVFIGYSIDEDKAAWKKRLKEHDMPEHQLWTGRRGPIIDDYKVAAVPQFIVFSKDGRLITLDAPRPSSPELKQIIENNI